MRRRATSRYPVPSRPAAVPPRRAAIVAREVRCPGDAADARAWVCASSAGTCRNLSPKGFFHGGNSTETRERSKNARERH